MNTSNRSSTVRSISRAFTLIEVLVVVAIIALLVSVLMPAMKSAKESAKATVCLSNLKQQGNGFSAYSKDNKQYLPYGGRFKYILIDGGRRNLHWIPEQWFRQGNGLLYQRYTGNTVDLFYCSSNTAADADAPVRGKKRFLWFFNHPHDTSVARFGDDPAAPIGAYAYALPLANGKSPRDGTKSVYPDDSMTDHPPKDKPKDPPTYSPHYSYLRDTRVETAPNCQFLGRPPAARTPQSPNGPRGAYPTQALLVDAYFGGYAGYHVNGWNVLYSDFHARRVGDPTRKIDQAGGSAYGYSGPGDAPLHLAWDYLSSHP